jgi:DNA-binding MarR family transcriptional regulator
MAAARLSQLQQAILRWLVADHQRTRGMIASSHQELVRALHTDKSNLSHSLRTLETHGLVVIGRSPGGQAESVMLTAAGHQRAARLPGSCD